MIGNDVNDFYYFFSTLAISSTLYILRCSEKCDRAMRFLSGSVNEKLILFENYNLFEWQIDKEIRKKACDFFTSKEEEFSNQIPLRAQIFLAKSNINKFWKIRQYHDIASGTVISTILSSLIVVSMCSFIKQYHPYCCWIFAYGIGLFFLSIIFSRLALNSTWNSDS